MEQLHTSIYAKSNIALKSVRYLEQVVRHVHDPLCQLPLRFVTCVTTGVVMREPF